MNDRKRFAVFFFLIVLYNLAANFAHPVTPTVIKELNLHDYMFGVAFASMMVTNFLMSPFWGKLNSYISSRSSLFICCIGYGAAQVWFALARTELSIIFARMFAGFFVGGIFVSFLTYIVNVGAKEDQGRYLTINATIRSVAGAFGYLIGGFLGEVSVRLTFFLQAGMLIALGVLFFLLCRPDAEKDFSKLSAAELTEEANPFRAFLDCRYFLNASLALLFAVNVCTNFSNTAFDQAFNYYLKDALGLTSAYNGLIKAGVGLVSFLANTTLCVWILRKTHVKRSLTVLLTVCAVSSFLTVLPFSIGPFILFSILVYAGYSVSVPVLQSLVVNQADPARKNLVMGFFNATQSLGSVAGSLIAGFIYSIQAKSPFLFTCAVYALAVLFAAIYGLTHREKQKV